MAEEEDVDDDPVDEREGDEPGDGDDEDGSPRKKKEGGKGKVIIIIAAALLLVLGGVAAAYFTGLLDPLVAMISGEPEAVEGEGGGEIASSGQEVVFYDLPELLVNMNTSGRRSTFLKIRVSLELASAKDVPRIEAVMPRIIDNFQVYLRELRVEDLKGSAGMYRLREELLTRVAAATAPAKINDVLFKEMLLQ